MNVFQSYENIIKTTIQQMLPEAKELLDRVTIEAPKDPEHGDMTTNAAMVLAKFCGKNPRELAQQIAQQLQASDIAAPSADAGADAGAGAASTAGAGAIESISIAGPGFINIKLRSSFWHSQLTHILTKAADYGKTDLGKNTAINVEFVSANPTGPMHVGHCRGAVVGDVLANLLSYTGYNVTKEYYINDAGNQIDSLAHSVLLRYRQALGESIGEIPAGLYPGDYLISLGQKLAHTYGKDLLHKNNKLDIVKNFAVEEMMQIIKNDLAALNIKHDVFFSEKQLHQNNAKAIQETISDLTIGGHVYKGQLEAPKGGDATDWESREQLLFRSTKFGDDQDRALVKSDGTYAYFAADIAYFRDKFLRGFKEMIYILGADHSGYVKRLEAVAQAVAVGEAKLDVLLCQLVKLYRNGSPVRMSKRSGDFVTLRDVVTEVGCDAVRFMMIYRKTDAPLDFDFNKVTEQSKDNPVFYVQYAVARCHSVYRQAATQLNLDINLLNNYLLNNEELLEHSALITQPSELQLLQKLCAFPQLIKLATLNKEPHRLAFYLFELASLFHSQWNKGNDEVALRFIQPSNKPLSLARLGLVKASCTILTTGLNIIGIAAPETMK